MTVHDECRVAVAMIQVLGMAVLGEFRAARNDSTRQTPRRARNDPGARSDCTTLVISIKPNAMSACRNLDAKRP